MLIAYHARRTTLKDPLHNSESFSDKIGINVAKKIPAINKNKIDILFWEIENT